MADKGGGSNLLTGLGDLLIPQTMGGFNQLQQQQAQRTATPDALNYLLGGGYKSDTQGGLDPRTGITWNGGRGADPSNPIAAIDPSMLKTISTAAGPQFNAALLQGAIGKMFPPVPTKEDFVQTDQGLFNVRSGSVVPGTGKVLPGTQEFVNLKGPDGQTKAYSKAAAAPLIAGGSYQVAGDLRMTPPQPKTSYAPMTPAQLQQWGLPPGTVAAMSSEGKPDIVNKASPGSFLTDQGIAPDATPDEVRAKLSSTTQGANIVRQADAVLSGNEELAKVTSRSGETLGNQIRSAVYALDPSFNPMIGKQRVQVNQELNNLSDKAFGGKLASADKIVNHSIDLIDSALDMKNNSMFGNLGNRVENAAVGVAPGSAMKTNIREFNDIRTKLATESAKFMGGGAPSDAARNEVNSSYNPNDDLAGTAGAVAGTLKTMVGQVQPLVDRYNQAYGTNLPITDPKFMSPETAKKLTAMQDFVDAAKSGKLDPKALKTQLQSLGVGRIAPGTKTPGASTPPAGVVIQNGWKYDAVTHKPIGPANGGR